MKKTSNSVHRESERELEREGFLVKRDNVTSVPGKTDDRPAGFVRSVQSGDRDATERLFRSRPLYIRRRTGDID